MNDVVLQPQTVAMVGTLLTSLVLAIGTLCGAIAVLYRQVLRERDRLLDERNRVLEERDARLVDLWRDLEEKEIRITTLEASNERLQKLATDATEGWKTSVSGERAALP
jgi:predicted RNase H-like nuclease (RuvC/YqgF family)